MTGTLDASYGRLQGCSGQDQKHNHSALIPVAFGGNNCSGSIDVAAGLNAKSAGRYDSESETLLAVSQMPVIAIQERMESANINAGPGGKGYREDGVAYTLEARPVPQSVLTPVVYRTTGNDGVYETGDKTGALTTSTDPNSHVIAFDTTQITSPGNYSRPQAGDACHPLAAGAHAPAVAFQTRIARNGRGQPKEIVDALTSSDGGTHADSKPHVAFSGGVRRLTPTECLRLQGFPDDHFDGAGLSDSQKYRLCGNAVAVPCAAWIGRRIISSMNPT